MPRGRPNQGPKLVELQKPGWRAPVWYIRWSENGRSRERTTGTADRGEAEQIYARWLIERGRSPDEPTRTGPRYPHEIGIADILDIYGTEHAPNVVSSKRIGQAIIHLLDWWRDRRVDAIRPATCRQYVKHRTEMPRYATRSYRRPKVTSNISITTAAKELGILRAALRYAEKNGHLIQTPFVEMPPPQPGRDRWVTRSEAARLLWESRREPKVRLHLPLFVMIALYTGARSGAILGLRWTQVDFIRGRIDFNEPGRARTNKRRAIIPIPHPLQTAMARAQRRAGSPFVLSYDGKRIANIRKSFMAAAKRAELEDVTPHVLRHTAGTWLAQRGVPLWQIAGWLGHSQQRTTELYAHHSPDHFGEAKRAMERRS